MVGAAAGWGPAVTAPTREQLLVLADRTERGPLTAAEADRLRQGITAMYVDRRTAGARAGHAARRHREAGRRLLAVQALIRVARERGTRSIPVPILSAAVYAELQLAPPRPRQRA